MSNIAIILRGIHYKPETSHYFTNSHNSFDFKNTYQSFINNVFVPLQDTFGCNNVDTYIISYLTDEQHDSFIINNFDKDKVFLREKNNNVTQSIMLSDGINHFPQLNNYNFIIILRFDFLYKQKISAWTSRVFSETSNNLWLAFKMSDEHLEYPDFLNFMADTIFIIKNENNELRQFNEILSNYVNTPEYSREPSGMHYMGNHLLKYFDNKNDVLVDGAYDTNTSYDNRIVCKNPIYVLHGRNYFHEDYPK